MPHQPAPRPSRRTPSATHATPQAPSAAKNASAEVIIHNAYGATTRNGADRRTQSSPATAHTAMSTPTGSTTVETSEISMTGHAPPSPTRVERFEQDHETRGVTTHVDGVVVDVDDEVADEVPRRRGDRQIRQVFRVILDAEEQPIASVGQGQQRRERTRCHAGHREHRSQSGVLRTSPERRGPRW